MKTQILLFVTILFTIGFTANASAQREKATDANIHGHVIDAKTRTHIPFVTISIQGTTIGTVADVMRLNDENRALVRYGLNQLQKAKRPGVVALLKETGAENRSITSTTVGYTLAPRINAAGRMANADIAVKLLMSDSYDDALYYAAQLDRLNSERQSIEQ